MKLRSDSLAQQSSTWSSEENTANSDQLPISKVSSFSPPIKPSKPCAVFTPELIGKSAVHQAMLLPPTVRRRPTMRSSDVAPWPLPAAPIDTMTFATGSSPKEKDLHWPKLPITSPAFSCNPDEFSHSSTIFTHSSDQSKENTGPTKMPFVWNSNLQTPLPVRSNSLWTPWETQENHGLLTDLQHLTPKQPKYSLSEDERTSLSQSTNGSTSSSLTFPDLLLNFSPTPSSNSSRTDESFQTSTSQE